MTCNCDVINWSVYKSTYLVLRNEYLVFDYHTKSGNLAVGLGRIFDDVVLERPFTACLAQRDGG